VKLCVESGAEPPEALAGFLSTLAHPSLGAVVDPGALAMRGYGVLDGVRALARHIDAAYARDGRHGQGEADLGEGDVPWNEYVAELVAAGFDGFQIVRCTRGDDRVARSARAVELMREL
jgi:sugar phosphate isomerase/epimerase